MTSSPPQPAVLVLRGLHASALWFRGVSYDGLYYSGVLALILVLNQNFSTCLRFPSIRMHMIRGDGKLRTMPSNLRMSLQANHKACYDTHAEWLCPSILVIAGSSK